MRMAWMPRPSFTARILITVFYCIVVASCYALSQTQSPLLEVLLSTVFKTYFLTPSTKEVPNMTDTTTAAAATTTTTSTSMNPRDHQDEVAEPSSSTEEAASKSSSIKETSPNKRSLRAVMVSCIDSALEELGPIDASALARFEANPMPVPCPTGHVTTTRTDSSKTLVADTDDSTPTAESLYGPSSKLSPNLRAGIPRRYHRRNSVTKYSLSCALKEVQKDDRRTLVKPNLMGSMTNRHLWHQLYNKHPISMKGSAASFEMPPSAKRRRGGLF